MSSVLVIDVSDHCVHADAVIEGWVDAGLARAAVWGRHVPEADEPFAYRLLGRRHGRGAESLFELLNEIGDRQTLHVLVLASTDSTSSNPRARNGALLLELEHLTEEVGEWPSTTLLLIPHRKDHHWQIEGEAEILELWDWSERLIVSPEDAPSPDQFNEAQDHLSATLLAHMLIVAGRLREFAENELDTDQSPDGPPTFRLIHGWARIVDGGNVADHVAVALRTSGKTHRVPLRQRLDRIVETQVGQHPLSSELERAERPASIGELDEKSAIGFFWFALKKLRFLAVLIETVATRIEERLLRRVRRALRWIVTWLGGSPGIDAEPPKQDPEDPIEQELRLTREAIEQVAAGGAAADPPRDAPHLWRTILPEAIQTIRREELTLSEAIGNNGEEASLLGAIAGRFAETRDATEAEFWSREQEIRELLNLDEPNDPADPPTPGFIRKLGRRTIRLLSIAAALAFVVLSAFVPPVLPFALALLGLTLVGPSLWSVIAGTLAELRHRYLRQRIDKLRQTALDLLRTLREDFVRFAYRSDQLSELARVLHHTLDASLKTPPMDEQDQGDFSPQAAPRAMRISTAVPEDDSVQELAHKLLIDPDVDLLAFAWQRVEAKFPDLYAIKSRSFATSDVKLDETVAAEVAQEFTRNSIASYVEAKPLACLTRVVEWERERSNEHGLDVLEPPLHVGLGPTGRMQPENLDTARLRAAFAGTTFVVDSSDGPRCVLLLDVGQVVGVIPASVAADYEPHIPRQDQTKTIICLEPGSMTAASPLPLGSFSRIQQGASVVAAAWSEQGPEPSPATVTRVHVDGRFEIDTDATIGSPILDTAGSVVLGVVEASSPTSSVGVLDMRTAVFDSPTSGSGDDLDPGLVIPIDVALGGRRGTSGAHCLPAATRSTMTFEPIAEWLEEVWDNASNSFQAYVVMDATGLRVDESVADKPYHAYHHPSGRLLICTSLVRRSGEISVQRLNEAVRYRAGQEDARHGSTDV